MKNILKHFFLVTIIIISLMASASLVFADSDTESGKAGEVEMYTIEFYDIDNNLIESKTLPAGSVIVPPEMPGNPDNVWMNKTDEGDILTATSTVNEDAQYRPKYLGGNIIINVHINEADVPEYAKEKLYLAVKYPDGCYPRYEEPKYIKYEPGVNDYQLPLSYDYYADLIYTDRVSLVLATEYDGIYKKILFHQDIPAFRPEESSSIDVETNLFMIPYVNFEIEKKGLDIIVSLDEHNLEDNSLFSAELYEDEHGYFYDLTFDENKQCTLSRLPAGDYFITLTYNRQRIFDYYEEDNIIICSDDVHSPTFTADLFAIFSFFDANNNFISSVDVLDGNKIPAPEAPQIDGKEFSRWVTKEGETLPEIFTGELIKGELRKGNIPFFDFYPEYVETYTIKFYDYNNNLIESKTLPEGSVIVPPEMPGNPDNVWLDKYNNEVLTATSTVRENVCYYSTYLGDELTINVHLKCTDIPDFIEQEPLYLFVSYSIITPTNKLYDHIMYEPGVNDYQFTLPYSYYEHDLCNRVCLTVGYLDKTEIFHQYININPEESSFVDIETNLLPYVNIKTEKKGLDTIVSLDEHGLESIPLLSAELYSNKDKDNRLQELTFDENKQCTLSQLPAGDYYIWFKYKNGVCYCKEDYIDLDNVYRYPEVSDSFYYDFTVDSTSDYTVYIYDGSYGQPINKKLLKTLNFDEPTEIMLDNYFEESEPFDDGTYVRGYWNWTPYGEPLHKQNYEELHIGDKLMVNGPVELIVVYTNKRIDIRYLNDDDSLIWYYRAGQTSRLIYPETPQHSKNPDIYTFDHWEDEYGNKYYPGKSELDYVSDSRTLKAVYTPNKYNVTFRDYDNSIFFSSAIPFGEKIEVPEPKREGYTFTGWSPVFSGICNGEAEYTAQYKKNPIMYTIRFVDYNDNLIASNIYKEGGNITIPTSPTRDGYRFTGWSPNINNKAVASVTYKATYEKKEEVATPTPTVPTTPSTPVTPVPTQPTPIEPIPAPKPVEEVPEPEDRISESDLPVKTPERVPETVPEKLPELNIEDVPVPKPADIKEKAPVKPVKQETKEKQPLDNIPKKSPLEEIATPIIRGVAITTLATGAIGVGLATTGGLSYWWLLLGCLLFKKKYPKILGIIPNSKRYVSHNNRPIKKRDIAMYYESFEDMAGKYSLAEAIDRMNAQNCYSIIEKSLQSIEIIADDKLFTIEKSEFENFDKILCDYINFNKVEVRFVYDDAEYSVTFI